MSCASATHQAVQVNYATTNSTAINSTATNVAIGVNYTNVPAR